LVPQHFVCSFSFLLAKTSEEINIMFKSDKGRQCVEVGNVEFCWNRALFLVLT